MLSMLSPLAPMLDAMDAAAVMAPACRLTCDAPRLRDVGASYEAQMSAPGVKPADVHIEAAEGLLHVRGETKTAAHTHFVDYVLRLPDDADADAITAEAAHGLLTVSVPKAEKAVPAIVQVPVGTEADEDEEASAESSYTLTIVAAGLAPSDLALSVEDRVLKVAGATERTGARLARSYRLPKDADAAGARATHVDGILTIAVPKKPAAEPVRVAVQPAVTKEADEELGVMV